MTGSTIGRADAAARRGIPIAVALVVCLAAGGCVRATLRPATEVAGSREPQIKPMSVRGLHCWAPTSSQIDECEHFIREVLPKEGVNVLIVQFHYYYQFKSHPEIGGGAGACAEADVKRLVRACRESGVQLIPQINCLGHQDMPWAPGSKTLLAAYPEFDERPGTPTAARGPDKIRCYCPRHPNLHPILFDLIDELAEACEAEAFHVGMDEAFHVADPQCPRCAGHDRAEVFAEEVNRLHAHLAAKGRRMWMWGDRLIDAGAAGTNLWEGSATGTHKAVERIPRDIVICDWHYDKVFDTPRYFIDRGFRVVACPWNRKGVALGQHQLMRDLAMDADPERARRAFGMVQTTWTSLYTFAMACRDPAFRGGTFQPRVETFRALFEALRMAERR